MKRSKNKTSDLAKSTVEVCKRTLRHLNNIEQGLEEAKQHQQGKKKLKTFKQFLKEL